MVIALFVAPIMGGSVVGPGAYSKQDQLAGLWLTVQCKVSVLQPVDAASLQEIVPIIHVGILQATQAWVHQLLGVAQVSLGDIRNLFHRT